MSHECRLVKCSETPTVVVRRRAAVQALSGVLGPAFGELMAYLGTQGVLPAGEPFVAYHNMDMANLDLEIGFPVPHSLLGARGVMPASIPAGSYVTTLHVGPYDQVAGAYEDMGNFMKRLGLRAAGAYYESYYDPPETPPERLRTRVMVRVEEVPTRVQQVQPSH